MTDPKTIRHATVLLLLAAMGGAAMVWHTRTRDAALWVDPTSPPLVERRLLEVRVDGPIALVVEPAGGPLPRGVLIDRPTVRVETRVVEIEGRRGVLVTRIGPDAPDAPGYDTPDRPPPFVQSLVDQRGWSELLTQTFTEPPIVTDLPAPVPGQVLTIRVEPDGKVTGELSDSTP